MERLVRCVDVYNGSGGASIAFAGLATGRCERSATSRDTCLEDGADDLNLSVTTLNKFEL
jgi:hypothetical protein